MKRSALLLSGVIFLLFVYAGLVWYSLSRVEVVDVRVDALRNVSADGFVLGGEVVVLNGGLVPVSVDGAEYELVLVRSGGLLASGYVDGGRIPPGDEYALRFSAEVAWDVSRDFVLDLLSEDATMARLEGTVFVTDRVRIGFSEEVDLEGYLSAYAGARVQEGLYRLVEGLEGLLG